MDSITLERKYGREKTVNIFKSISSSSSKDGRKSWWAFFSVLLFSTVFSGYHAVVENDSARRQKTSLGTIGQCEVRGRGNDNYCDYTFTVGDDQYTAVNKAASGLGFGQTVTVYYDSRDPRVSALEDFSGQSRGDMRIACISGFVFVVVIAFVPWDRSPFPEIPGNQRS
jgi:hypothetical protein